MSKDWYKDWFSNKLYLDIYKHRDEDEARDIVNLIQRYIPLKTNSQVLDVCCGAGRNSLELARRGYQVTGFDLSKFLINEAKKNLQEVKEKSLKVRFLIKDMRKFHFNEKYDIAVNIFTSFGYFESNDENFKVIKNVSNSVRKGGYFVFDYLNLEYLKSNLIAESKDIVNEKIVIQKRWIENNFVIKKIKIGNQVFSEILKLYSFTELKKILNNNRFIVKNVFGDYFGSRYFSRKSKRLIIFGQKI